MAEKDPDDFAPYAGYLHGHVWPSENARTGELTHVVVDFESMPPQYASAALAKLCRWARVSPEGDIAMFPDEDSREYEVRCTPLARSLAARAVNLNEELFYATYGEFGVGQETDAKEIMAEIAVALGDHGLDWDLRARLVLAARLTENILGRWKVTERLFGS